MFMLDLFARRPGWKRQKEQKEKEQQQRPDEPAGQPGGDETRPYVPRFRVVEPEGEWHRPRMRSERLQRIRDLMDARWASRYHGPRLLRPEELEQGDDQGG